MHNIQRVPKECPASVFHFFTWRSGWTRGAGTKNSNSTSPPPLLLCCCCCAAASAAPRSAIHRCSTIRDSDPRCIYRDSRKKCSASVFHFLHLAFWFAPGCWDQKQQLHAAAARRALTSNLAWVQAVQKTLHYLCLLYTSPSPRDQRGSRMPSSA